MIDAKDVCATSVKGTFQGEPFVNVLHFGTVDGSPMDVTDLAAIHNILDDAITDNDSLLHIWGRMDSGLNISQLYSRTMSTTVPVELASAVNLNGTSGGADVLPMTSVLIKWTTSIANRRYRGRTYLTGLNTGMWQTADTDYLDTTFQSSLQGYVNDFVTAWGANATYYFAVWSRAEAEANVLQTGNAVLGGSVQSRLALQRRRSPGR